MSKNMTDSRCPKCNQSMTADDENPPKEIKCQTCGTESVLVKADPSDGYGDNYYYYDNEAN